MSTYNFMGGVLLLAYIIHEEAECRINRILTPCKRTMQDRIKAVLADSDSSPSRACHRDILSMQSVYEVYSLLSVSLLDGNGGVNPLNLLHAGL